LSLPREDKLERILQYKEKINNSVKDILEILHKDHEASDTDSNSILEIEKKFQDIIYSFSSIGTIWGDQRIKHMHEFMKHIQAGFHLAMSADNASLRKFTMELFLSQVNSVIIQINEKDPWKIHIDFDALRARISALIEKGK